MKLLIDVFTPGNGKTYEFQLDGSLSGGQAAAQIIEAVLETENNAVALDPGTAILSDANTATRLNPEIRLAAAGVKSGHKLILV
ncbi:MAG: hypothetical protein LBS10_10460 [Gracilibacteraceae bacterium]|jgi:hypothetical protein|nr:hypothetical protein [Gracilibacteraceae bacterium]